MRLLIAEDEVDLAEALTVFFEKITSPSTPCTTASTPMNMPRRAHTTPSF